MSASYNNTKMNNSAAKVGEIFTEAGAAFNKLAEMTMLLHSMTESTPSQHQPKTPVKKKLPDDRTLVSGNVASHTQRNIHSAPLSQQVTLNMLNAQETEMDTDDVKLEFESSTEEVTT